MEVLREKALLPADAVMEKELVVAYHRSAGKLHRAVVGELKKNVQQSLKHYCFDYQVQDVVGEFCNVKVVLARREQVLQLQKDGASVVGVDRADLSEINLLVQPSKKTFNKLFVLPFLVLSLFAIKSLASHAQVKKHPIKMKPHIVKPVKHRSLLILLEFLSRHLPPDAVVKKITINDSAVTLSLEGEYSALVTFLKSTLSENRWVTYQNIEMHSAARGVLMSVSFEKRGAS